MSGSFGGTLRIERTTSVDRIFEHAAFTQQQRPCSVRAARPKSLSCPNGIALRNAVASTKPDTMAKQATHRPITATVADALVHVPQPMPLGSVVADIGMTV
jgi:hypothetical protein